MEDKAIESLREALRVSPENVPLRRHLADMLSAARRFEEAIEEYKRALALAKGDASIELGLAEVYLRAGRTSEAIVIVEAIEGRAAPPAAAYVLHAQMLLRDGEIEEAVRKYRIALDVDPDAADPELSERLGVSPADVARDGDDDDQEFLDPDEMDDELSFEDREVYGGRVRQAESGAPPSEMLGEIERPRVAFDDVGGMEAVKDQIRAKIIHPLQHPEIYEAYGKKIGGGILMYGPPGCGKTHLARATAGEVEASFIAVGLHDVLDMWIGRSERNLNALFEQARAHKPCILFFDEVDALGASRTDMRQSASRQVINQFLSELDGVHATNDGVLVLAATNTPWHLDSAFRRPGRFDRIIFVSPPDEGARAEIVRILLADKPVKEVDRAKLAKKTEGFSGADLKAMVDTAVEGKLEVAVKTGIPEPLATKDLLSAAKKIRASTKEWFATARNYALYSNEGGVYDDILSYMGIRK